VGGDGVIGDGESVGLAVLGGGPAGLTAAYVLALRDRPGVVFEADGVFGGLAKTVEFSGYRFDIGGHRFFTKLAPIAGLWEEMLGEEFLTRPRLSRIYYRNKYLQYPLVAKDVVKRIGLLQSFLCASSYFLARLRPRHEATTFEDWVTSNFGQRLYDIFFRSYTEKVWGIPGSEIQALWAAQRIKNFTFMRAVLSMLGRRRSDVTTLIEEFRYPRYGPGQMWEEFARRIEARGVEVRLNHRCTELRHAAGRVESLVVRTNGSEMVVPVDAVLSSLPLRELVLALEPAPPAPVVAAARKLRYRDFVLVALITSEAAPFPDNWIYLHDPNTRAGRVQNFGAWSDGMVQPGTTCLGVEYFCFEGDEIWEMDDASAVELAKHELARIGLIDPTKVIDGVKVRVPKAYPMYDLQYTEALPVVQEYLEGFENLATCGRNGLHRYNNQDHSMWTAILAVSNLLDNTEYDVWSVNTEAEYHEEGEAVEALLELELVRR
jgi:protoporphyrinogen oxidase